MSMTHENPLDTMLTHREYNCLRAFMVGRAAAKPLVADLIYDAAEYVGCAPQLATSTMWNLVDEKIINYGMDARLTLP